MKRNEVIVDADFCIKIGSSSKYRYLEKLFPELAEVVYIHKTVYGENYFGHIYFAEDRDRIAAEHASQEIYYSVLAWRKDRKEKEEQSIHKLPSRVEHNK